MHHGRRRVADELQELHQHPSIIQGSLNGAAFWVGSNNAKRMVDLRDFPGPCIVWVATVI